jgi:mRNA interferase YafQ
VRIKRHKKFLKDFANAKLTDKQFEKLIEYINNLKLDMTMPPEARDHALKGEWKDFRECHLGGDMLLVYREADFEIVLTRLGTHNQIFNR